MTSVHTQTNNDKIIKPKENIQKQTLASYYKTAISKNPGVGEDPHFTIGTHRDAKGKESVQVIPVSQVGRSRRLLLLCQFPVLSSALWLFPETQWGT